MIMSNDQTEFVVIGIPYREGARINEYYYQTKEKALSDKAQLEVNHPNSQWFFEERGPDFYAN